MKRLKTVEAEVGGLSNTSKMPGRSWSVSARHCKTGSKLRKVEGSVCSHCYALKGRYVFNVVQEAQDRRRSKLKAIRQWTERMVELLSRGRWDQWQYFRWFDSGDLQSMRHLKAIVEIAERLPQINFWLPTKEYQFVRQLDSVPSNLVIRVSSPMVGQGPMNLPKFNTSTVGSDEGHSCPAYKQGGHCGNCRACWDPSVPNVDYPLH